ncbi:MAG: hypothetical protein PHC75_05200 [Burkholderiales bacterium]|nr:hypothetical protein [Burkholderiales bacterium]
MKQNYPIKVIITVVISSLSLIGCSNGASNTPQPTYPQGPISYKSIQQLFTPQQEKQIKQRSLLLSGSGCGAVMAQDAAGLAIASGFISLIPYAGPALAAVTGATGDSIGLMGTTAGNNCIIEEFANMQAQLNTQAQEINQIVKNLNLSTNEIWNQMTSNDGTTLSIANNLYSQTINTISSQENGAIYQAMTKAGFWNPDTYQVNSQMTINNLLSESNTSNYSSFANYINTIDINSSVQQISGTQLNNLQASKNNNSEYINMLSALYNAFETQLVSQASSESNNNIVIQIDQYNQTVMALYQQSLYTMQQAYTLSYLINNINYTNYRSQAQSTYLSDISYLKGAYYNPTDIPSNYLNNESGQSAYYNYTQETLTNVYAQLVNQLYLNTLNYIITDSPVGNQSYPDNHSFIYFDPTTESNITTGEKISYSSAVGSSVTSATNVLYTAMQNSNATFGPNLISALESAAHGQSTLYYQYSGIHNVAQCSAALSKYNAIYGSSGTIADFYQNYAESSCEPVLASKNGAPVESSIMSWSTIQPYYIDNGYPSLMGSVINNISACNGNSVGQIAGYNLYNYVPQNNIPSLGQIGVPYLMCGNWSTGQLPSNQQIITELSIAGIYYPGFWPTSYWEDGTYFSFTEYMPITVMNFNMRNWNYENASNLTIGSVYTSLFAGWMNYNYPSVSKGTGVSNIAAIQVTFPDGFIAPLGFVNTNISGWSGNYAGISINPNILNVTVDGNQLLDTSNVVANSNQWGPAANSFYAINNDGIILHPTAFRINNNTLMANGDGNNMIAILNPTNPVSCSTQIADNGFGIVYFFCDVTHPNS